MRNPWTLARLAVGLVLVLLAPSSAAAQKPVMTPHYDMIDVGTFGGPQAYVNLPGIPITRRGAVLGTADTTVPDTDYPNFNPFVVGFPDPVLARAFAWENGKLTDLGALPGNNSSAVFEENGRGIGAGLSETEAIDPFTGWPAVHAVLFKDGQVQDLGTLPGGHESFAIAINDRGQVAGFGSNAILDPYGGFAFSPGWPTEVRSFVWQKGVMRDIGTLGGNDALMSAFNERGQMTGGSFTNTTANDATGLPTLDPFLWEDGGMRDLGTLGGTFGVGNWLNNRGQVAGQSDLAGDQASHPFLWDGHRLVDLGTFGGDFGSANYVNDAGHVVGFAAPSSNDTAHAFLWKRGTLIDLTGGGNPDCTFAGALNTRDQVVGGTCSGDIPNALVWIKERQYDLNRLVAPSDDHLTEAVFINDRGQIVALGTQPDGSQRLFLLNPDGRQGAALASAARQRGVRTHALKTCFGQPRAVTRLGTANCRRPFNSVENKGCCA